MSDQQIDRVLRYKPTAQSLGVSVKTLQRLIARGEIATVDITDRIRGVTESERSRFRVRGAWRDDRRGCNGRRSIDSRAHRPAARQLPALRNDFGEGPHKASLRCCNCIAHRGRMSREVYAFVEESVRGFGRPTEPIIIRRGSSMTDQKFDNSNSGVLFRVEDKKSPKHADYSGSLNAAGLDYWCDGYIRQSSSGRKFISFKLKLKEPAHPFNDDLGV